MGIRFRRFSPRLETFCRRERQWIADGAVEGDVMFVGGALSVDQAWRTEGLDWWADEELSIAEFDRLIDVYATVRPRVMVTHDCPGLLEPEMISVVGSHMSFPSRTRQAFDAMFVRHRPEHWVFGHWHRGHRTERDGCTFVCLGELDAIEVPGAGVRVLKAK